MEELTYDEFIQNILNTRGRFGTEEGIYKERHHIKPKCIGGTNDENNLIDLYAREHFIVHKILAEENPNNDSLVYAWACMAWVENDKHERYQVSPEEYELARTAYSKMLSETMQGENNPFYGKHHTEETKKKLSDATKEQNSTIGNPFLGKHHTDKTKNILSKKAKDRLSDEEKRQKLRDAIKEGVQKPEVREKISIKQKQRLTNPENHPMYGKKHSDKTKQKISEAHKGKEISEETRRKISASQKGKKMSDVSKDKIRKAAINGSYNKRCVVQLTKDWVLLKKYPSSVEAERQTGVKRDNIWRCCNLKNKTAGGYIWRYIEDWERMQNAI